MNNKRNHLNIKARDVPTILHQLKQRPNESGFSTDSSTFLLFLSLTFFSLSLYQIACLFVSLSLSLFLYLS